MTGNGDSDTSLQTKQDLMAFVTGTLRSHPMAWSPEDFVKPDQPAGSLPYVIDLGKDGVSEIEQALEFFKDLDLDGDAVCRNLFPLPTVQAKLDQACQDIHEGRGFAVVRGLDPRRYSDEDNVIIYLGVASYIGDIRGVQNRRGSMLRHITASKSWDFVNPELRYGIHTNSELKWHTDTSTDILALHVRALAGKGGDTFIASSWAICRELATSFPKDLEVLQSPSWPIWMHGKSATYKFGPLLQFHRGKIFLAFDTDLLGKGPSNGGIDERWPLKLSPSQDQALDTVASLASKHSLRLDKKPGDILFINNYGLLHARDQYIDSIKGPRRHLVRLWLRNSRLGWDIPTSLEALRENVFGPRGDGYPTFILDREGGSVRGGTVERHYPVVPPPRYRLTSYGTGSAAFTDVDHHGDTEDENTDVSDN